MAKNSVQEIAGMISGKHGLSQQDAEAFVNSFFDLINEGLHTDKSVKVKGLGTFKVIDVRERESVNVNTGERVLIESHGKITFTADPVMRDLVNKPFAQFETVVLNDGVELEDMTKALQTDDSVTQDNDIYDGESENESVDSEEQCMQEKEQNSQSEVSADDYSNKPEQSCFADEYYSANGTSEVNESTSEAVDVKASQVDALVHEDDVCCNNKNMAPDNRLIDNELQEADSEDANCLHDDKPLDSAESDECNRNVPEDCIRENQITNDDSAESGSYDDRKGYSETECFQNKAIEQFVVSGRIDDDVPADTTTSSVPTSSGMAWYYWLLILLAVACLSFFGGYYWSQCNIKPVVKYVTVKPSVPAMPTEVTDSVMKNDSVVKADDKSKQASKDTVGVKENVTEKADKYNKADKSGRATDVEQQSLKNATAAVRTGAYRIVGTDRVVTVKSGETLKKISRFYLGEGMECYIMVHNGITDIKEGMRLKIPKLVGKRK